MLKSSQNWIKELIQSELIEKVELKSSEYDFFSIKGFDSNKILLAVYKLNHCNCWDISFQQREGVWHSVGNFPEGNDFVDAVGDSIPNGWRDDIQSLKYGFDSPVDWIKSFVK